MKTVPQEFYLDIRNNTAVAQRVVLFDSVGAYAGENAAAGNVKYVWDITTELSDAVTNQEVTLVIIVAALNSSYAKYTYTKPSVTGEADYFTTAAQVVAGLNSLSIGTFSAAGNIITGYSAFSISSINICNLYTALLANGDTANGVNGSLIYAAGYSTVLIGNLSLINTGNTFWRNNPATTAGGPLNRSEINTSVPGPPIPPVNLFGQTNSTTAKTVYVGISIKGSTANLYVNNQLVFSLVNSAAMIAVGNNVNTVLSTTFDVNTIMYNCWHIVPVVLQAGNNIIQVETGNQVGVEVYDNTAAEIAAATSYNDLNILFSSTDYVGQQLF